MKPLVHVSSTNYTQLGGHLRRASTFIIRSHTAPARDRDRQQPSRSTRQCPSSQDSESLGEPWSKSAVNIDMVRTMKTGQTECATARKKTDGERRRPVLSKSEPYLV